MLIPAADGRYTDHELVECYGHFYRGKSDNYTTDEYSRVTSQSNHAQVQRNRANVYENASLKHYETCEGLYVHVEHDEGTKLTTCHYEKKRLSMYKSYAVIVDPTAEFIQGALQEPEQWVQLQATNMAQIERCYRKSSYPEPNLGYPMDIACQYIIDKLTITFYSYRAESNIVSILAKNSLTQHTYMQLRGLSVTNNIHLAQIEGQQRKTQLGELNPGQNKLSVTCVLSNITRSIHMSLIGSQHTSADIRELVAAGMQLHVLQVNNSIHMIRTESQWKITSRAELEELKNKLAISRIESTITKSRCRSPIGSQHTFAESEKLLQGKYNAWIERITSLAELEEQKNKLIIIRIVSTIARSIYMSPTGSQHAYVTKRAHWYKKLTVDSSVVTSILDIENTIHTLKNKKELCVDSLILDDAILVSPDRMCHADIKLTHENEIFQLDSKSLSIYCCGDLLSGELSQELIARVEGMVHSQSSFYQSLFGQDPMHKKQHIPLEFRNTVVQIYVYVQNTSGKTFLNLCNPNMKKVMSLEHPLCDQLVELSRCKYLIGLLKLHIPFKSGHIYCDIVTVTELTQDESIDTGADEILTIDSYPSQISGNTETCRTSVVLRIVRYRKKLSDFPVHREEIYVRYTWEHSIGSSLDELYPSHISKSNIDHLQNTDILSTDSHHNSHLLTKVHRLVKRRNTQRIRSVAKTITSFEHSHYSFILDVPNLKVMQLM